MSRARKQAVSGFLQSPSEVCHTQSEQYWGMLELALLNAQLFRA
jgi:hypothetical protein